MSTTEQPVVLIVEDERDLADLYAEWLKDTYGVRTAYSGSEASDLLDDEVDIVLLDRRMPDRSGDAVLDEIRERGLPCRVAMVTAVEPDFDIIEMGFDDYLVKPVSSDDLHDTVDRLLRRNTYTSDVQELAALASKKAILEAEKSIAELAESEEYAELEERFAAVRERADTSFEELDHTDFKALFRDLEDDAREDEGDG